jgi:hypothetical protein
MRTGNMVLFATLTALICAPFSASHTIAEHKTARLSGRVHSLDFSKIVPGQLNYQGFLANAVDSSAVTATLEMTFRLFDSETKGAELWSETHPTVEVSNGLFHVLLGKIDPFPEDLFDGSTRWLQTEVGTEILSPRKPLASVAYSQRSQVAQHADWAGQAEHAIHADTAEHCPSANVWMISGDNVYRETGKVGIGTSNPLTELDVNGSASATTYYGDGSNLTGISGTPDGDWTISGNHMYSAVPGSVGVGTSSPENKLHIAGDVKATTYYGDGSHLTGITGTTDNDWTINGDDIYHETGNVGIGTASPTAPLTIQTIPGTDVEFSSSGSNADMVAPVQLNIGTSGIQNLHLMTGYLTRMCITGTGQVGIGTTSPAYTLDVTGDVNASTYYGDGSNLTGISGTPDGDWTISGIHMYSAVDGNVGIGTTSPSRKLTVDGGNAIIKGDDGWDGSGDEALLYLGDPNHGIEAVYGEGVRIWTYDGPGADIRFRGHTGTDYMTVKMNTGNVGIGTINPDYKLQVHSAEDLAGYFLTTQSSDDAIGCYCVATPGGSYHATGLAGRSTPADWHGCGVSGMGGYVGVSGSCYEDGQVGKDYYGVKAVADLYTSNGTSYGVYGWGSGGSASYGVYYAGGLGGSGPKSAIVRTEQGPKAVYCQESPENWFEDFGSGQIYGARAEIHLADDFRQTVTVNEIHPMKVFITPNAPIGEWWVEKGTFDFTLMAPDAPDGARFDYRVVAKRQGYEELRLEAAPSAYVDHFLYPQVDEVPLEYREAWQRSLRAEERTK